MSLPAEKDKGKTPSGAAVTTGGGSSGTGEVPQTAAAGTTKQSACVARSASRRVPSMQMTIITLIRMVQEAAFEDDLSATGEMDDIPLIQLGQQLM